MIVGAQQLQAGTFTKHLVARQYRRSKFRRQIVAALMLTSMIDMFSLLVIFLLQSFSNSNEVLTVKQGLILPAAITSSAPVDAPILSVSTIELMLENQSYGKADDIMKKPDALLKALDGIKTSWVKTHPGEAFQGVIHLEADRGLSSALVSRVINLLTSQGFASIQLAMVQGK